jgi:hypothetical protein
VAAIAPMSAHAHAGIRALSAEGIVPTCAGSSCAGSTCAGSTWLGTSCGPVFFAMACLPRESPVVHRTIHPVRGRHDAPARGRGAAARAGPRWAADPPLTQKAHP